MADLIPGINVGNAFRQVGSFVGLAPKGDYDVLDYYTNSNRAGQQQINALPDVQSGPKVLGTQAVSKPTGGGGDTGGGGVGGRGGGTGAQQVVKPQTYTDSMGRQWNNYGEFQRNQDKVRRNVGIKQTGYLDSARSSVSGARSAYNNDAEDFVTGLRQGQNTINSNRVNNALNLRRSMAGIASGVRQGIRSGAVNLANMNAMDSGASAALAQAFARQGNSQAAGVNNEAQIAENQFAAEQTNLGLQRQQGLGRLKSWRDNKVKDISNTLWQNLAEIDAMAQDEELGGLVDMGARDRIVADANNQLNEIDAITQRELGKIQSLDMGQVNEQASELDAAGALVKNPFAFEGGTVQWGHEPTPPAGAPIGPIGTSPIYRDDEYRQMALPVREEELA